MNYIERLADALEHGIERGIALVEDLVWECHKLVNNIKPVTKATTTPITQCVAPVSPAVVDSISVKLDVPAWMNPSVPPTRGEPRPADSVSEPIVVEHEFESHNNPDQTVVSDSVSVGDRIDIPQVPEQNTTGVPAQKRPYGGSKKESESSDTPLRKRTTGKSKNRGRESNTGPVVIKLSQMKLVGVEYVDR